MIKELEIFIRAYEKVHNVTCVQRLRIEPMAKPAYKKLTLQLHIFENNTTKAIIEADRIYRIVEDNEKQAAIDNITEELLIKILSL